MFYKVYNLEKRLAYGVIGNTTVSGTVILGSSPGGEAFSFPDLLILSASRGFFV